MGAELQPSAVARVVNLELAALPAELVPEPVESPTAETGEIPQAKAAVPSTWALVRAIPRASPVLAERLLQSVEELSGRSVLHQEPYCHLLCSYPVPYKGHIISVIKRGDILGNFPTGYRLRFQASDRMATTKNTGFSGHLLLLV